MSVDMMTTVEQCENCEGWGVDRIPVTSHNQPTMRPGAVCKICEGAGQLLWRPVPYWGSGSTKPAAVGVGSPTASEDPA